MSNPKLELQMKSIIKNIKSIIANFTSIYRDYLSITITAILITFSVTCGWKVGCFTINGITDYLHTKQGLEYTRDVYIQRLESKFDASREELAQEIDKYINSVAPNSDLDALNIIDLSSEYDVDLRLILAQGYVESHFGTKGSASKTHSVFNVGAYDGHSASTQIKNRFGYRHPNFSVEPYLKLLTNRYLVNGKTEKDLLDNFVDENGSRYASSKTYESALRNKWKEIDSLTNITQKYNAYKMYKLKLGR